MEACISAPGKSILMGEHAAVYGRPALVAAVDRRATAEIRAVGGSRLRLDLPQVGVREEIDWSSVRRYTASRREIWEHYRENPRSDLFRAVRGEDPAHLVKIALGEAAAALGDVSPPGLELRLRSEIPLGSGFGSSAAVAVAVAAAYLALRGAELTHEQLHRLTLDVERRQHGQPSGVDNLTVILGGLVWAKKETSGELTARTLTARRLTARGEILSCLRLFHSGAPAESTGDVVAAVGRRVASEPGRYEPLLDRMATATEALCSAIEAGAAAGVAVERIRDFEACLEELGVVPPEVRDVVRQVEREGGAAKISGAGSLAGPGAGALLVFHPEPERITGWEFLSGLEPLDLRLGAGGVRRES